VVILCHYEVPRHSVDEVLRILRSSYAAVEHLVEGHIHAVLLLGVVRVLGEHGAVQVDAREQALAARVGQELRIELPIGARLGVATNGAG